MMNSLMIITSVSAIFLLFIVQNVYAESEFFVYNTKGSYNLGCELDNSCFEPYNQRIQIGDIVTWINNDDAIHVVVSGEPNSGADGLFDSGFLKMNESFSFTFDSEGNFRYFCTLHPWMNGLVTVGNVEAAEMMMDIDYKIEPVIMDTDFKIEEFRKFYVCRI